MKLSILLALGAGALAAAILPACSTHGSRKDLPVAGEVTQVLGDVMAMAEDSQERSDLERKHEAWLFSRADHCTALAEAESREPGRDAALSKCLAALDKERVRALHHTKLRMLVRQPPVGTRIEPVAGFTLPLDSKNPSLSLAISRDGRLAAVGTYAGAVEIFDLPSRLKLRSLPAEKYAAHLWFTTNGRVLITGSRQVRGMKVWDVHKGELLREHEGVMGALALLPDDRHVVYSDVDRVVVYDFLADRIQATAYAQREAISKIAVSPDGKHIAALSHNGTMMLWDVVKHEGDRGLTLSKVAEIKAPDARSRVWEMAFSRGGDALYTVDLQGLLGKRQVPTLRLVESLTIGRNASRGIEPLPSGNRLVVAGSESSRGSYLLFLDLDRDAAIFTDISRGTTISIAIVPGKPHVYVATQHELRRVEVPKTEEFQPVQNVLASLVDQPAGERTAGGAPRIPILHGVATGATIEAIGVYQGVRGRGEVRINTSSGPRIAAPVMVFIGKTDKPVILVLSSYEPVLWTIRKSREAQVRHIFMSGYYDSAIEGISGVEITKIAGAYAYELKNSQQLNERVREYTGRGMDRFQSAYSGREFFIGAVSPTARADPPAPEFRCIDAQGRITLERVPCARLGLTPLETVPIPQSRSSPGPVGIPVPSAGERVIRCGGDTIICGPGDTVHCGGKIVACQ